MRTRLISVVLLFALGMSACITPAPPTLLPPTATPVVRDPTDAVSTVQPKASSTSLPDGAAPVVISEVMAGLQGNNNYEFIELYNRSPQPVDLRGWSLWYRLAASSEDLFVYRWKELAIIPPYGHYLLGYTGQDLGLVVDAQYEQALNTNGGGLELRRTDGQPLDRLAWGKAPTAFLEGSPAQAMQNGQSLERRPGGSGGNGHDQDDNAADFTISQAPTPQNTGSPLTPLAEQRLEIQVSAPETVQPGSGFDYTITVANLTGQDAGGLTVSLPIPAGLTVSGMPEGANLQENVVTWTLASLKTGEALQSVVSVSIPWTYRTLQAANYSVQAANWPVPAYGGPVRTRVEGGFIPISAARDLVDAELVVEGTATMYTGGYFAGAGNVKFYLEDETGGIQVQVFEGEGAVSVRTGDRVRVRGKVEMYRGAVEIVPTVVPGDVEVLAPPSGSRLQPSLALLSEAAQVETDLAGRLVQVEGLVNRVEEYTYSYEIDLLDEQGQALTLYVDKQTNTSVEAVEPGKILRATGILDVRDGSIYLYPRRQDDLEQIFAAVLRLDASAPGTALAGSLFTYTLTAYNHTSAPLTGLRVRMDAPASGAQVVEVRDGGRLEGGQVIWDIPELGPDGQQTTMRVVVRASGGQVVFENVAASASEWPETVSAPTVRTFIGETIPIWAIQGDGFRSPYVFEQVRVEGVVTGVFPDLGGFFIQETFSDSDPLTSPGLFVTTSDPALTITIGDLLQITGVVREASQQTVLQVSAASDVRQMSQDNPLPAAIELDPPRMTADAQVYFEALEGAYVRVSGPALVVAPTTKFGEYALMLPRHNLTRLYQGDDNGLMIMVDDGSSVAHSDRSTLAYVVASGDQVSSLVGPLAYTFDHYKIEPVAPPTIIPGSPPPPSLQSAGPGQFSLMTWNVENLFDPRDPHPSDPPKPRLSEYERHLTQVATTITAAGSPTLVALQEVENIGVLQDLAGHPALAGYHYQPFLIEGFDSRGIDVGYLVRSDLAAVVDVQQRDAPDGLTSRPPLIMEVKLASREESVYVINNHFTSMSGGEEATEPRRIAQAAWNLYLVNEILAQSPNAQVAVVGDLNSYAGSRPIQTLLDGGLRHVFDAWHDPHLRPYTYIYQGESQVLDHILVTPALMSLLERVEILHINADYPLPEPGSDLPMRKSDHDPVVVVFNLQ